MNHLVDILLITVICVVNQNVNISKVSRNLGIKSLDVVTVGCVEINVRFGEGFPRHVHFENGLFRKFR